MIIAFNEIPVANKGGEGQDRFETFACDFLETIGYKIIRRPDRGADGKKDLIVSERRTGVGGETTIKWLVSCKHYAHSNKSVTDKDEIDIRDRVEKHDCQGFIGIYSTISSSSLSDKLHNLGNKIEYIIYDAGKIEKDILLNPQKDRLLACYFPSSHERHKKQFFNSEDNTSSPNSFPVSITEEDILRITKSAIILIEIEKIKEEYQSHNWETRDSALNKLFRYSEHSNEKIATTIFDFLGLVASQTRSRMPSEVASTIHSLILTFFPSSYDKDEKERIENGKRCINIGGNIVYDALIYLNNYRVAEFGLSILKYVYIESQRRNISELKDAILREYEGLEHTLSRPERNDLENAKHLVAIFKSDLATPNLSFPILPEQLQKLISDKK